ELTGWRPLDPTTEVMDHQLHPVTDAEHRDPELEELAPQHRSVVGVDGRRPTGKNQPIRRALADLIKWGVMRQELRKDAALANPSGNELAVLPTEIEHEYFL